MKTVDYLDAVKAAYLLTSDYQLAKKLSVSTSRIGNYRSGTNIMDDEMAIKIALLLEESPLSVLADAHVEREEKKGNSLVFNFWKEIAKHGKVDCETLARHVA